MKNPLKTSFKYVFSIIPLGAILLTINLIGPHLNPKAVNTSAKAAATVNKLADIPCGFVAKGPLQQPQKPTFVTNNNIPVLQYPTGNFPGTTIQVGNAIYSASETDQLILQEDGNLVLYCTTCQPVRPLWSTQTRGKEGRALYFQSDGDLVLRNAYNKIIWHSNIHSTCAGSERAYFSLQDDGNLVMLINQNDDNTGNAFLLGSTGCTNDQPKSAHQAKIE